MAASEDVRGWVPSITHPSNAKSVASCCDTLHLTFAAPLARAVAQELESLRTAILESADVEGSVFESEGANFELAGRPFALHPAAARGYRYRLINPEATINLRRRAPDRIPTIQLQLRSRFLWRMGWRDAALLAAVLVRELAGWPTTHVLPPLNVSRADLCVDFQGWTPTLADLEHLVTRGKRDAVFRNEGVLTGVQIGTGVIVVRIYDKTCEIKRSGKEWMRAVWEASDYDASAPVWRLEAQLRRPALRELGAGTVDNLHARLGAVWAYVTQKWVRLVIPPSVGTSRRDRRPIDPRWMTLMTPPGFDCSGGPALRARIRDDDVDHHVRAILGHATSMGAVLGHDKIDPVFQSLRWRIQQRLKQKGLAFEDVVAKKVRSKSDLGGCTGGRAG